MKGTRLMRTAMGCITVLVLMLFTACSFSKDGVSLKGEKSLKKYADGNCPECTFVRYEEEEYRHTAYFTDDRCGFEFTVSSSAEPVYFDGTQAGYEEKTASSWDISYYNYVIDSVKDKADKICSEYGMAYEREKSVSSIVFLRLTSDKPYEQLKDGLAELGRLFKGADVCGKYTDYDMRVEPASEEYGTFYAFYRFKDDKTGRYDDWQAYRFMDFAEQQLGVKCTYERTEKMKTCDIPGITKIESYSEKTGDKILNVYYFTTEKGEKKLIADYRYPYPDYYICDVK